MAKEKMEAAKLTEYKLPDGAVVHTKKPTNGIRRLLVEQPETNLRFLMEIVAAACIVKMVLPGGYAEDVAEDRTVEFEGFEREKNVWARLDDLSLMDNQAFISAFEEHNLPTRAMVDSIVEAVKKSKAK